MEFLGIEVLLGAECCLDDDIALLGAAKSFRGNKVFELLANSFDHGNVCYSKTHERDGKGNFSLK